MAQVSLYLIEILHQTTTKSRSPVCRGLLYLIEILHQTTTSKHSGRRSIRCILSKFYIKPQPFFARFVSFRVVSYRNSTSNHNHLPGTTPRWRLYLIEILHQTTTIWAPRPCSKRCILSKFYIKPQHNLRLTAILLVVSYRNSTSNHNSGGAPVSPGAVVSYRNSTSNHNRIVTRSLGGKVVSYRNSTSNHNPVESLAAFL